MRHSNRGVPLGAGIKAMGHLKTGFSVVSGVVGPRTRRLLDKHAAKLKISRSKLVGRVLRARMEHIYGPPPPRPQAVGPVIGGQGAGAPAPNSRVNSHVGVDKTIRETKI